MITQRKALARMEQETRSAMRRLEDSCNKELLGMWSAAVSDIRASIIDIYRQDFGKDAWDLVGAHSKGTLGRISAASASRLSEFKAQAGQHVFDSLAHIHNQERLRALWMIDQTTPQSFLPKHPFKPAREAAASPRDAKATWQQAFGTWIDTYHTSINSNLKLETLHEGDIHDAADEAAATRIGGYDPAYKFSSMFSTQALTEEADARRAIFDANEDVEEDEIWQTMEDTIVCAVCDDYDGKPMSKVPDDQPAHYRCRCYSRFVPKAYAEILRSGTEEEKQLALDMDAQGLVPDSIAIRSEKTGDIIGRGVVSFSDWQADRATGISGVAGML